MRVLLLHLRPTELENKTLQEGLQMILKELTDKSNIHVVYKDMVKKVPKRIENNLFRIAQEFISNTLKHAKASQIEVYLYQNSQEIQLKMLDNGVGYDLNASTDEMSYGLKISKSVSMKWQELCSSYLLKVRGRLLMSVCRY